MDYFVWFMTHHILTVTNDDVHIKQMEEFLDFCLNFSDPNSDGLQRSPPPVTFSWNEFPSTLNPIDDQIAPHLDSVMLDKIDFDDIVKNIKANQEKEEMNQLIITPPTSSPSLAQYKAAVLQIFNPKKKNNTHTKQGRKLSFDQQTRKIMVDWLLAHENNPYPTPHEWEYLIDSTGLTKRQVSTFLVNNRSRILHRSPKKAEQVLKA